MGSRLLYVLIPATAHSTYKNALTQIYTKVLEPQSLISNTKEDSLADYASHLFMCVRSSRERQNHP